MASTMAYEILRRDAISDLESVPSTFSSWDNCMSKAYCKWPVIIGIVIGSLILLSLITCLARCMCFGMECCCACCSCLRCCDCFTPSSRRNKSSRYRDEYQQMPPTPYAGYQPTPAPMMYQPTAPQFATFDANSNRRLNEDSLPAMPSWDTAATRRVEDVSGRPAKDDVEMGHLSGTAESQALIQNSVRGGPSQNSEYMGAPGALHNPHAYNADLGAQRLSPVGSNYRGLQPTGNTPAPSYHTYPEDYEEPYPSESDRFVSTGISPSPYQYNHNQQQGTEYAHQGDNFISPVSTRYEAPDYHSQGYANHNTQDYAYQSQRISPIGNSPTGNRAPSFMQIRRPVNGSTREV